MLLNFETTPTQEADKEGETENAELDGKLNFDEFCSLFKELAARPELRLLFNKYSSKMEWLTVKDLQKFLQLEQGAATPSVEFCTQLIQKYEPTDEGKAQVHNAWIIYLCYFDDLYPSLLT